MIASCMRLASVFLLSIGIYSSADATSSHPVRGHIKKNGTYVAPHKQTNPNQTQRDNWSAKGNTNPMTGKDGQKNPRK